MNFLKTNILHHIDGAVQNISGVFPVQAHGLSYSVGPGGAENHYLSRRRRTLKTLVWSPEKSLTSRWVSDLAPAVILSAKPGHTIFSIRCRHRELGGVKR